MTQPNLLPKIGKRQLHLDFHNSPELMGIGDAFDADTFAQTLVDADIDSVTLFAKCHHGMCYYPSRHGTPHPGLKDKDLLGEQIEALHRKGIRCPLYFTIGFDEVSALQHPDWRQLDIKGYSVRARPTLGGEEIPGGWYFMNWLHPDYMDLIYAQVEELLKGYTVDGLFFDIVVFDPEGGWSPFARHFREQRGLEAHSRSAFDRFLAAAQDHFCQGLSGFIRGSHPQATIFYNAAANLTTNSDLGIRVRAAAQSHYEIESLPTGHWGYPHFPRIARFVAGMNLPWTGQTGRFQKSWGDFGGLKPEPALEYECYRSQALGGTVGVGDQLLPNGTFDAGAIHLIGSVYAKVKQAEAFYEGAKPYFDIGILATGSPGDDRVSAMCAESGALLLCQYARRNPILIDTASDFTGLAAIILPDQVSMTPTLAHKLEEYTRDGGKLILSHRSGFDASGLWQLDFLPIRPGKPSGFHPTYWRIPPELSLDGSAHDRVVYSEGLEATMQNPAKTLIERVLPAFQRSDAHFSSHFQAPPQADTIGPAVIGDASFLYFADPIFRDFRQSGQQHIARVWVQLLKELLGSPIVNVDLPQSIEVIPMRKGNDLLLTLLRYLPVRKALEIDIIDEGLPFGGQLLQLSPTPAQLLRYPDKTPLTPSPNGFILEGEGRLLLQVPEFFA